jgi:predicted methyltransferase
MRQFQPAVLTLCLLFLVAAAACSEPAAPAADDAEPAAPAAAEAPAGADPAILDHPVRSDDDRYRDTGFKPLEVYDFFGIAPGAHVADLMPGGGYNTVLVSQIVGDTGTVTAILRPTAGDDPERVERSRSRFTERITPFELGNLAIVSDPSELADDSVDVILTVRNYHDLGLAADRVAALPEFLRILKPGGIFAVVDAYTDKTDERDESVHRINDELTMAEITGGGFEFVEAADMLINPDDTFDFDGRERAGQRGATEDAPIHRYFVSRFVHKYRKPAVN